MYYVTRFLPTDLDLGFERENPIMVMKIVGRVDYEALPGLQFDYLGVTYEVIELDKQSEYYFSVYVKEV